MSRTAALRAFGLKDKHLNSTWISASYNLVKRTKSDGLASFSFCKCCDYHFKARNIVIGQIYSNLMVKAGNEDLSRLINVTEYLRTLGRYILYNNIRFAVLL